MAGRPILEAAIAILDEDGHARAEDVGVAAGLSDPGVWALVILG